MRTAIWVLRWWDNGMMTKILSFSIFSISYEILWSQKSYCMGWGWCLVGVFSACIPLFFKRANHDHGVGYTELIAVENRSHNLLIIFSGYQKFIVLLDNSHSRQGRGKLVVGQPLWGGFHLRSNQLFSQSIEHSWHEIYLISFSCFACPVKPFFLFNRGPFVFSW